MDDYMEESKVTGQEPQNIVCFGDSNTFGAHGFNGGRYSYDQRWTGIISQMHEFSGKYNIINMGENGREIPDSSWEMDYVCRQMSKYAPIRLLVIMLGSNDMLMMARSGMPKIVSRMELFISHLLAYDPGEDEEAARGGFISKAEDYSEVEGGNKNTHGCDPSAGPGAEAQTAALSGSSGSGFGTEASRSEQGAIHNPLDGDPSHILMVSPVPTQLWRYGDEGKRFDEMSLEFPGAYRRLARKYGMEFVSSSDWGVELGPDGVHFTEKGHKSFADGIARKLAEIFDL